MMRRSPLAVFAMVSAACANNGTILYPDGAKSTSDAASDVDDAADVAYDRPQFDIPQPDVDDAGDVATDATSEAPVDAVDVTLDVSDASVDAPEVATDAGRADVSDVPDTQAPGIDHCYVIDPRAMDLLVGSAAQPLNVAVFVAGVTAGAGRGAGVSVEVGVGAGGSAPLAASGWVWAGASYDRDIDGRGATGSREYDRYQGSFPLPAMAGEYAYAARARLGTGAWTACDFVQTMPHAYDAAFAGRLTVMASGAARVGFCNLQSPRTLSIASGATGTTPVYGRVFASGVTTRGCTDTPLATELTAQWGYGPNGSFPSTATWTWIDGRYNDHRDSMTALGTGNCQHIEYMATPRAPMDCATRSYGWRFRLGTGPWTYCRWAPPAEGAPSTPPFDTWDLALAGTMTVTGCL